MLTEEEMERVAKSCCRRKGAYWFGKTGYNVIKELELPVTIRGRKIWIKIKMLDGNVPFLIGRKTIDWKIKMDFGRRVARIRVGTEVTLEYEVDRGGYIILRLFEKKEKAWLGEDWRMNCTGNSHTQARRS